MTQPEPSTKQAGPSRGALMKGAIWTFVGAIVVTVLFILPAEYGIDPTGIGEKIGLTRLAGVAAPEIDAEPRIVEGTFPQVSPDDEFDFYEPETLGDPFSRTHDAPFRSASMVISLEAYEQVEVKAIMDQGDALVYSWRLTEGDAIYSDFHADPLQVELYPELYWVRYLEREGSAATGSLVAPFRGHHGWYWLNIEENPVKVELEVRGYFESLEEIMRSFQ